MVAETLNLTCEQGATFSHVIAYEDENGEPIDLTGCTAAMQVRASLTVTSPDTPVLSLTSSSGITLGGKAGTLLLKVSHSATSALAAGDYHYDLELTLNTSPLTVRRIRQGTFTVVAEYTR